VESGEGIESPRVNAVLKLEAEALWNPVKELKGSRPYSLFSASLILGGIR